MKRPLMPVALLYVGGILVAEAAKPPAMPLLSGLIVLTAVAIGWSRVRLILLYPLIILAGLASSNVHTALLSPIDLRLLLGSEPHLATLQGKLIETPGLRVYQHDQQPAWRTLVRMQVSTLCIAKETWRPASGCVAISTAGLLTNYFSGETVAVTGVVAPPRPAVAEGTFDYRNYLRRQGIYYQLSAESENDWQVVATPAAPPLSDRFSAWARHALALGLPTEDESLRLEWALALGWRTALTEEACEPLVRAATYHIFAVDGLRMAIVFGIFYSVLRAVAVPRSVCGLVLIPVIWFYVALTGWPASAIRASVMLTIIVLGWALKRPSDPINSLFAAALIILVWDPQQIFQAGFQLSFFVVLCLILTIPRFFELMKRITAPDPFLPTQLRRRWPPIVEVPLRYTGDLLVTSFAAWIGSLPLVAYYFNIITPVSTPANIVAVPVCVLVLISNLLSLLFAAWFPAVAILFNHAGWFGMECIRVSSEWFAKWPAAYWYVPAPSCFTTCLYYALLIAVVTGWAFKPALRNGKIAGFAVGLAVWLWSLGHGVVATRLTILPAGGGTVIYCDRFGSREDLLIDAGTSNSVQFITKPFLRAQGVNSLPALLLTHGDVHHTGGTEPLTQLFNTPRIYLSPARFRSVVYRRMTERLDKTPGLLERRGRGSTIDPWVVLHPDSNNQFAKADDAAIVLRADLNGTRVLLLSDLGRAGQDTLLKGNTDLHADIVVAGLPSAGEPLCDELIDAIKPRLIIISDSEFPVSERASPKLHARMDGRSIRTLYTRETGAISLTFRKGTWESRTMSSALLRKGESLDGVTLTNSKTAIDAGRKDTGQSLNEDRED